MTLGSNDPLFVTLMKNTGGWRTRPQFDAGNDGYEQVMSEQ